VLNCRAVLCGQLDGGMLLTASLLHWMVWDTLFALVAAAETDLQRRVRLREFIEKGDCTRSIIDSPDLRPLLVDSVQRQMPYLVVMGRTLAALLAKDRDNDEQHLNETLHSSAVLNSVMLLGFDGTQPHVRIAQRRDHTVQGHRSGADTLLNTLSLGDVNGSTPGYFLQPNCSDSKFSSWTAAIGFAVSERATPDK
jgi:hypothetical protein